MAFETETTDKFNCQRREIEENVEVAKLLVIDRQTLFYLGIMQTSDTSRIKVLPSARNVTADHYIATQRSA